ncbi:MAG: hypothetical protein V7704_13475 [Aurantimonas endophytica]|uniref:hypothetical protein n=1 Tax=Aurantimonas endophytica TaxID=1522175 RepID=UPI003001A22C
MRGSEGNVALCKPLRSDKQRAIFMNRSTMRASAALLFFGVSGTLAGCVSPQEQLAQDQGTCANMGATYGSPAHTRCMLQQQQRRDDEMLRFTQQAYLNQEMARTAQEMRDRRRD